MPVAIPKLTPEALLDRAGRVCVAVAGLDMLHTARRMDQPFVEFRLDSLAEPAAAIDDLRQCLADRPTMTAVATCRRTAYGGAFAGSAQQQVHILCEAARAGCALVDIESETAEELGASVLETLRAAGAAVVLSWHDFAATPDLEAIHARMRPFKPDFYKIVPTATSLRDGLQLLDLLKKRGGDGNLIAMSMGFRGVFTRILGPRFGSAFTFASADGSGGTAPGQVSVRQLRELYRIDAITPQTAIYGVAGQPITGSKSPLMHNTAFAASGTNAVYVPFETADAAELMEVSEYLQLRGLSVTMPLKSTVLPLLTRKDGYVHAMSACNTIARDADGAMTGFNTDVDGILGPLERRIALQDARVLVLGAGGAARAACFGLSKRGAQLSILNRTREKAEALAAEVGADVQNRETLSQTQFNAILNCTPYGMLNQRAGPPIHANEMNCSVFFDLVYNPVETPLALIARQRGIEVIPGVEMFVEQGVRQFELWTRQPAPRELMLRAVLQDLRAQT